MMTMLTMMRCPGATPVAFAGLTFLTAGALGGPVDLLLTPVQPVVESCAIVEIDIMVSSADGLDQPFDALDAIVSWDPAVLELLGIDDSRAEATFFISDFLPDPDGINDDLTDGEVLYTALAPAGNPISAPGTPDTLIVTTFRFQTLQEFTTSDVSFIPTSGTFGQTRVLLEGGVVTGDTSDIGTAQINTCTADVNVDGMVSFEDLLRILSAWGLCPPCCPEDLDGNGGVDFGDILIVLTNWGVCP